MDGSEKHLFEEVLPKTAEENPPRIHSPRLKMIEERMQAM
jgi:hypothetical protein